MADQNAPVGVPASAVAREEPSGDQVLALLLAMAMFVLVVDTSLMNVSISAVVRDLDTTASGCNRRSRSRPWCRPRSSSSAARSAI
jgi:hypothetical protein